MITYIEVSSDGKIHNSGKAGVTNLANIGKVNPAHTIVEVSQSVMYGSAYWDGKAVIPLPAKPSEFHKFNYTVKNWEGDADAAWNSVKQRRTDKLEATDWVVTKATERNEAVSSGWLEYRQALRDITEQTDPWNIVWPESP